MLKEMDVMDPSGHTKTTWDADNPDEVKAVEKLFSKLVEKGYAAFRVKKDGGEGEKMKDFDPNAEKMIMVPPLKGG